MPSVILLLLSLPLLGAAQERVLTLPDALSMALKHNRDVKIAEQDIDDAQARIAEIYGRAMPQLTGSVNYTRNIELPVLFLPPNTPFNPSNRTETIELGSKNSVVAGLAASQTLFDAQLNTGIQLAKRYRRYVELTAQSKREEVVRNVKLAFYGALLAERLVEVSAQSVELARAHCDNLKLLYENGVAAEFDLLRAEVRLANSRPVLSRNENNFHIALDNLKHLLGMEPDQAISLDGSLTIESSARETGNLMNAKIDSNTTLRSMQAQQDILNKNIRIESAAYFPTLSAFANYDYQSQDNSFDIADYQWVDSFIAGLTLSVPLFNGFQTKYRIAQARINRDRLTLAREQAADGIRIQISQAALSAKEALERYQALAESVSQAQRAMEIADIRYLNGVGTQLELLDAQTALTQIESEQAVAAFDHFSAIADWELLIGEVSTQFISTTN